MGTINTAATVFETHKKFGVTKSVVRFLATKSFSINSLFRDCFKRYYIIYWTGEYFLFKTKETGGVLTKDGIEFLILYHNTNRGRIASKKQQQVVLSFREPQPEFGLPAYVLVSQSNSK